MMVGRSTVSEQSEDLIKVNFLRIENCQIVHDK